MQNDAAVCRNCPDLRAKLGAKQEKLTIWCPSCESTQDPATGLCLPCQSATSSRSGCHHFNSWELVRPREFRCAEPSCGALFHLCEFYTLFLTSPPRLLCKKCLHAAGNVCICCESKTARNHIRFFRCCKLCIHRIFCAQCMKPPPTEVKSRHCRLCPDLALWFDKHCSATELKERRVR